MYGRLKYYILLLFLFHQRDKIVVYGIGKQYLGCYVDLQPHRILTDNRLDDKNMTNDMCASHCCSFLNDATFMGTEFREECYCSNVPNNDSFVKTQLSECNALCGGNPNEFCGASHRLSLYKLDCSPDTTIESDPSTTSDISSVIQEVTTKFTVAAHSSATTSLAQFTLISSVGCNNSVCSCANCMPTNNTNWTEEELKERLSWLWNAISINKKETNMYKATKVSAYDPRKSSRNIGIVGVIVLCVPVIIVVAMDVQRICKG